MSRNFGLGTRDMASAGRIALARSANQKEMSFSTVDTVADRWRQFTTYAKNEGIGRMERITPELAKIYGKALAVKVTNGQLSPAYAQNLVSAINTVMRLVKPDWTTVIPTTGCDKDCATGCNNSCGKGCGIPPRSAIRSTPPVGTDRAVFTTAITALRTSERPHAATTAELARELGLRSKEAALLDAVRALKEAREQGRITISEGTKGGRTRELTITHERQIAALIRAAVLQGENRAVIPAGANWRSFREGELRAGREQLQAYDITGYHDLRSAYACERYQVLTGQAAPVFRVKISDRALDKWAREQLSQELGHGRIDVISEYIGGRG